jgi:hypothetical protein
MDLKALSRLNKFLAAAESSSLSVVTISGTTVTHLQSFSRTVRAHAFAGRQSDIM